MGLYLTHESALECWRWLPSLRYNGQSIGRPEGLSSQPPHACPTARQVAQCRQDGFRFLSEPVHLAVPDARYRSRCKTIVCHVQAQKLPSRSFVPVAKGVFVDTPEALLAHMATKLSRYQILELCYELCGGYRLRPGTEQGFVDARPAVDVGAVRAFMDEAGGLRGSMKVSRMLAYVCPNSESPMETVLALLLCLPPRHGGYGLPFPHMNYRFEVTGSARRMTDRSSLRADLHWPGFNLVVEYDSDFWHSGSERISSDARRRLALTAMGMHVVTVTNRQVKSLVDFDRIAGVIAQQLGIRLRIRSANWREAQLRLRRQLLPRERGRNCAI